VSALTEQTAIRLDSAVRQLVAAITQSNRLTRAHLKQWYKGPALQDRWELSPQDLSALLQREIGYVPQPGKPVRVHLDQVLKIDELLRAGREAALRVAEVA
jgi:hypothetical protein